MKARGDIVSGTGVTHVVITVIDKQCGITQCGIGFYYTLEDRAHYAVVHTEKARPVLSLVEDKPPTCFRCVSGAWAL